MANGLVAIVDDDEAVRLSTACLLTNAGFDVKLFESGESFLSAGSSEPVSCIVLDVRMPGSKGLAVLRALDARDESPPVIVTTAHGGIPAAVEAMKLGAQDFVEKPYEAQALLARIEEALKGRANATCANGVRTDAAALVAGLSGRQRQVLHRIVRGVQNKIIAYELELSIRTVEAYRAQLLQRLGCRGTAEAVRLAIAAGFLDEAAAPPLP
jgi:two-component system response regulator FixJ